MSIASDSTISITNLLPISYLSILSLGYSVTNALSASVGTIQGGYLSERENGADKEIELYDENETTLFGNLSLSF